MTSSSTWKRLERKTADELGGERIPCSGGHGRRLAGDVFSDTFYIECKYRQNFVFKKWYNEAKERNLDKKKILLILKQKHQQGEFVLLLLEDFRCLIGGS